jgi:hypothetical protein
MNSKYINALMNVYMFFSASARCFQERVQAQSTLELGDVRGEDLVVDVIEAELALLLFLYDVSRGKFLQMMRDGGLRDIEKSTDIRAV